MGARKYIISIPSLTFSQQVFPINDDDLVIKYSWNFPARIFYKKELSESLMFANRNGNLDFDLFYFYEAAPNVRCEEFILYIYEECEGEDILKYKGGFSLNNCIFNLSRCTVEVKPDPKDIYSCIESNRGKLYNILTDPEIISTTASLDFNYEFDSCIRTTSVDQGSNCDPDASGTWGVFHVDAFPLIGNPALPNTSHPNDVWTEGGASACATTSTLYITVVYREFIHTACIGGVANPPPGAGWVLETDDCATLGTAKWIRFPVAGDYPYSGGDVSDPQNQDIGYGYYDGVDCIPPPAAVNQQITITATPATPPIKGYTEAISQFSGSTIEYTYEVTNNPNSTYVWSSPGFTITSGSTTNKITGYFSTNQCSDTIVITCTETHGNAYVSAATISVDVDGGVAGSCPGNVIGTHDIDGLGRICTGKQDVYSVPEIPTIAGGDVTTVLTMVWTLATVGGGTAPTIISGQGTKEVVVESGTANFNISFQLTESWTNGGSIDQLAVTTGTMKVVVTNVPVCHPIEGIFELYSGEPAIPFTVKTHSGATYNWFAGNGDSGNGSTFSFFTSPTADTCLTLKETLDCGCNWVLIAQVSIAGLHPCIWWCKNNVTSSIYNTVYTRNRRLQAACEGVINNMSCGISELISDFFEWNPPGDTPGYIAGTNYWTGAENKLTDLTIAQKSDIIRPTTSNPATIGNMTFEQVEIMWREMFNAYWFIDANGKMRVEHLSYFQKTAGYDSTDAINNKYNIGKKKYNYNTEKMPKFERFKFAESLFEDFIGADIWYDSICVSQRAEENVEARGCSFISTDIYYINLFPQDINEEGFVILCNDVVANVYTVNFEIGLLSGNEVENGHLSWANLLPTYHKVGRVLIIGYMNNVLTNFIATKPIKSQKEIIIILCCDTPFEPENYLVTTELGDAHIEDAEYNLKDHTVKLNLLLS